MAVIIVVGLQWGDEGKGKMVDHLAADAVAVARYSGGANAGHTVEAGGRRFSLHLLPSGLVRPMVKGMIGAGCVMDPSAMLEEISSLEKAGVSIGERLIISGKVNLTHPGYRLAETVYEDGLAEGRIGTTGRGIGPTYERKFRRNAIRLEDSLHPGVFKELTDFHTNDIIDALSLDTAQSRQLREAALVFIEDSSEMLAFLGDVSLETAKLLKEGKTIIAEGAQGSLLDPDHGSYPFVTCGQCVSGAACTGLGFGPTSVEQVVGVLKAYTTRVGSGPFPTELNNPLGDRIREAGREYGTTTGRPRRCGWLDCVLAEYASRINGCTSVVLTLLDVLTGFQELRICTSYENEAFSPGRGLGGMVPVYRTLPGWSVDIRGETSWRRLPEEARSYVLAVEDAIRVPIKAISTGPGREEVIWR